MVDVVLRITVRLLTYRRLKRRSFSEFVCVIVGLDVIGMQIFVKR